jgi:hypothetical protein
MKKEVTIEITGDEIVKMLEEKLGVTFKKLYWRMKESGDHDRGNYKTWLDKVEIISDTMPTTDTL